MRGPGLLVPLLALALGWTAALPRSQLFPFGAPRGDRQLPDGDDETSAPAPLPSPLRFYETRFAQLYVGTNGIISTQDFPRETQYVDDDFPTDFPAVAPFLSDIDTSSGRGKIYYRLDDSREVLDRAAQLIQAGFPTATNFAPRHAFIATWENVGAYEEVTQNPEPSKQRNTFQAVLAYGPSDAYALFLYPDDGIQFFGTRPKESYNVHLLLPVRVGFSRGEYQRREGPYHTVTSSEQSVKSLYQTSNMGIPGVWVFHIGSAAPLDNVVPAMIGRRLLPSPRTPESSSVSPNILEGEYPDSSLSYEDPFYDGAEEEFEYLPITPTEQTLHPDRRPGSSFSLNSRLDYNEPRRSGVKLDLEQGSPLHYPASSHLPPYPDLDSISLFPLEEAPSAAASVSEEDARIPSLPLVYESPIEAVTAILLRQPGHEGALPPREEDRGAPLETESFPVYPEGEVILESFPDNAPPFSHGRRVVGVDEDVSFNPDGFTYSTANVGTCEERHGQCSQHAFCTDYSTGFCCHCLSDFYGNGRHCLPEGAAHRLNGKVSGNLLVGQTPVRFGEVDLHAYIVGNDGRAYTAISHIPQPAARSLMPLAPIGGLFGWLFALEKPSYENGFSITGAKFTHNVEVTFYPGEEQVFVKQTADGLDEENYLSIRTEIQGQVPYIPENFTVHIAPYKEIYHYSDSVVTSTSYREYTLTFGSSNQTFSYRLHQNITYQECPHARLRRLAPTAQQLTVDRIFALYNEEERVLRYAVTNQIGPLGDDSGPVTPNPCFDGTHVCDTTARCRPGTGLDYACECSAGYWGDGKECVDINECAEGLSRCSRESVCVNTQGSYRCECPSGYQLAADRVTCIAIAPPPNPCEEGTHTCASADRALCVYHGGGSFSCVCLTGYAGNGHDCTDVDECAEGRCHQAANCYNSPGSFACRCQAGYEGDGFHCSPGTVPSLTRCEHERRHSGQLGLPGGRHISECDDQGNYKPLQCHGSTGYCWCVDGEGQEISGSRVPPSAPLPRCGASGTVPSPTRCEHERRHSGQLGLLGGRHIPECDDQGNYKPLQCHGSTGYCWCVDGEGQEISGSRVPPSAPLPRCGASGTVPSPTRCEHERRHSGQLGLLGGRHIPECDDQGNYKPLQCHGSTGYCWCVDGEGQEIAGSRVPPSAPLPRCGASGTVPSLTRCEHERRHSGQPGLPGGRHIPECDDQGNYKPLQCHGSTGYCWCVDGEGQEISGSRVPPSAPLPRCGASGTVPSLTRCEHERRHSGQPGLLGGRHIPECDDQGNYKPLQCHGSTGYCWCVDGEGQEISGSRVPPSAPLPRCGASGTVPSLTRCEHERRHLGQPGLLGGRHIPECDDQGNYKPLQCHGSTGYCWCVDGEGQEISGSRVPPSAPLPRCGASEPTQRPQTMCERWRQSLLEHYGGRPRGDQYVPQCDALGNFNPLQCHGDSGYCWCVDEHGREIQGTRSEPGVPPACLPSVAPPTVRPSPRPDISLPSAGTFLLYAQGQQIGSLPLNGTRLKKEAAKTLLSLHGSIVVAIDYDCREKMMYWTDVAGRTISRASLEQGAEPETIITSGLISPEGLAIDHLRRTMFWTDSGLDKIESARLDGTERRVLFATELVNPRAIAVDPIRGNLYWTDWNREAPKIETSTVTGENRRILVNQDIGLPNGLTFDPFSKLICWADAGTKKLECALPNGAERRVIQDNLNYPFSIVSYANHFYHTDWRRDGVIAVNKDSGGFTGEYLPEQRTHLYGITVVHPYCPGGRK